MAVWRFHALISTLLLCLTVQGAETSNCIPAAPTRAETNSARTLERRREQERKLSPAEREAKRKEIRQRLEKRLADLREKEKNGTLTEKEKQQLARGEQILQRFDQPPAAPK